MDERVAIARNQLRMYRGRPDGDEATAKRLAEWERGGALGIAEAPLVTILQIARRWPDAELARQAEVDSERFEAIRRQLDGVDRSDVAR